MVAEEISQDCFVHRVAALPLVSFTAQQALDAYQKTKSYNGLLSATCGLMENSLGFMLQKAQPFYLRVEKPLQEVSKAACVSLNRLEEKYPIISITPDQVKQKGVEIYTGSVAERGVHAFNATRTYTRNKVDQGKQVVSMTVEAVQHPLLTLNQVLDACDGMIDTYVLHSTSLHPDHDYDGVSALGKMGIMGGKLKRGIEMRIFHNFSDTHTFVMTYITHFYTTTAQTFEQYKLKTKLEILESYLNSTKALLLQHSAQYAAMPSKAALKGIKLSSMVSSSMVNQLTQASSKYLPLPLIAQSQMEKWGQYLNEMNAILMEAESLSEVSGEVVSEGKEKLKLVQQKVIDSLDYVSDYPPVCWMLVNSQIDFMSGDLLLLANREHRMNSSFRNTERSSASGRSRVTSG